MRKISRILLMLILSVFILGYTASAQMDLNVQYDENTKIASISGTIEEKYAGSVAGLYIVAKDALFPDFSSGEYTDIFISLQNSIVGENGSFSFNDVDLSEVEGDIDFNVSILSDATGEIKAHSIYIPTREAIQNFLDKLASAQSGDDVLTLINANIENTLVDGKNVNIGLKGDIYVTYPELNKQTVADMIFASLDGTEISSAAEFKELHISTALICKFVNSANSTEVWNFINVNENDKYYKEIEDSLQVEKLTKLSVIKELKNLDVGKQDLLVAFAKGSESLQDWINAIGLKIINEELVDATDSYVMLLMSNYSDILANIDFAGYNSIPEYHGDVASAILEKDPYNSIKDFCDVANAAINAAIEDKEEIDDSSSSDTPSSDNNGNGGGGGGGGGGRDFSSQVLPVTKPEPIVDPDPEKEEKPQLIFKDMESVQWAQEAVNALYEKNILNGKEDGMFYPNDNITREEFVKILVLAFEVYEPDSKCEFADTQENAWFYPYVASACKSGYVNGINESEFGVGRQITREDAATLIFRAMREIEPDLEIKNGSKFADSNLISDYAIEAVSTLAEYGIINGVSDTQFNPKGLCTRAQVAKMFYEAIRR